MNRAMCGMAAALILAAAGANAATEQQKLTSADGLIQTTFGSGLSVDGDMAIIGAETATLGGVRSGCAYVFMRTGGQWSESFRMAPSDPEANDRFGRSAAISGDTVVIGAPDDDDNGAGSGSAYVFVKSGAVWTEQAKLTASDGEESDWFGWFVAISGDTIVVGAPRNSAFGEASGAAYVFVRNGAAWSEQAKLVAADALAADTFGMAVSCEGESALVGMLRRDAAPDFAVRAYMFERTANVWSQSTVLNAGSDLDGTIPEIDVKLNGDLVAVAYPRENADVGGDAYIFRRNGSLWVEEAHIQSPDPGAADRFGTSVAVSGDLLAVGATLTYLGSDRTGAAYLYSNGPGGWTLDGRLEASDGANDARLGERSAIAGSQVLISATRSEAIYAFSADAAPPAVSSITHLLGLSEPGLVTFTVTFSEPVTGVDASDFAIDADGPTGGSVVSVEGSGADYTVIIDTGSGTGTVTLTLVDDDSILDDGSNPLGGAGIGNGAYSAGTVVDIVAELPAADAKALMFLGLCLMTLAAVAMVRAMGRRA